MRGWRLVLSLALVGVLGISTSAAAAKAYRASRFDVTLEAAADGSIVVTERVVFEFGPDSFTTVFRDLPTRRTDGITVLSANMDGRALERGRGPGQYDVRRSDKSQNQPRVSWYFAPITQSSHFFELRYRVAGVTEHAPGADTLAWRILPTRHEYEIGCSQLVVKSPSDVQPVEPAQFDPPSQSDPADIAQTRFERCGFDVNRSWQVTLRYPSRTLAQVAPRWQQAEVRGGRWAPVFLTVAGVFLATGLMALFFYANNHRSRVGVSERSGQQPAPPSDLPVALAGVLTRPGACPVWLTALGAMLDLARRGIIRIDETDKRFGQRQFRVVKLGDAPALPAHERIVMDMLFTSRKGPTASATFFDLRRSVPRHWKAFRRQVREDLRVRGLISAEREGSVKFLLRVGIALVVVAAAAFAAAAIAVGRFQGWPLFVPGSITLVAVAALAISTSLTPLSDEGLRQAAGWRAFKRYLREVGRGGTSSLEPQRFAEYLPYAAAFGSALGWARQLKKQGVGVAPPWMRAMGHASDGGLGGLIVVLSTATSAGGHVDAGASAGAAGGGASGAH